VYYHHFPELTLLRVTHLLIECLIVVAVVVVMMMCFRASVYLQNPDGSLFAEKAEGVVLAHDADRQPLGDPRTAALCKRNALIVLDPDMDRPGRVCSVTLVGL
jgi:hypothetical protein